MKTETPELVELPGKGWYFRVKTEDCHKVSLTYRTQEQAKEAQRRGDDLKWMNVE